MLLFTSNEPSFEGDIGAWVTLSLVQPHNQRDVATCSLGTKYYKLPQYISLVVIFKHTSLILHPCALMIPMKPGGACYDVNYLPTSGSD